MEMQKIYDNACDAARMERMKTSKQLTLGEIILKSQNIFDQLEDDDKDSHVMFDFEYIRPTSFDSWRGIYKELALGFALDGDYMNIYDFIKMCHSCIGKTFTGYKGGDFVMSKHSPVWVANYGNSGETAIVEVTYNYELVLHTGHCEV